MERNPTDNLGTSGAATDSLAGSEGGAFGGTTSDTNFGAGAGVGTGVGTGASENGGAGGRVDQARSTATNALNQAKDMAGERLGQAKEKATQLKATLADRLESGANALRQQAQGGQLAGAGADGSAASGLLNNDQVQRLAGPAADAMQRTAQFLREGDIKDALEEQVRTNPARTLLIALGVGYLLGKAVRR
jgi:hypothetical protein